MTQAPVNAVLAQYTLRKAAQDDASNTAKANAQLFAVTLAEAQNKSFNNILNGDRKTAYNSMFGGDQSVASASNPLTALAGNASNPTAALAGASSASTASSLVFASAKLIGKKVTYFNPTNTKEIKEGTVTKISVEKGKLLIDVDGTVIPKDYLVSVKNN
ncbi:MAG: hypothetical protein WC901_00575 [Candidatus Margulisiibacteriota bacterium]